jgi:hypothetical protein
MNKIKLMYDVVKTMRDKEVFIGSLAVNGKKDQIDCFSFSNEFEKNNATGKVKFHIKTDVDCDGKQMKHESSSEFNMQNCRSRMHRHHQYHNFGHDLRFQGCPDDPERCDSGFKARMSGLMFILRLIDDMEIEELENKRVALTLNLDELPEGLMDHFHGRFQHRMSPDSFQCPPQHPGMKALGSIEKPHVRINIKLNQDKAIEAIVINADGKQKDESNTLHDVNFKADLTLKW